MTVHSLNRRRQLRTALAAALAALALLELLARQFVARPNRILRPSADPELVYESTPGNWLGHAKYDVWSAPVFMVLDLVNSRDHASPGAPPFGYTLYRIGEDGCRGPSEGPLDQPAEVVLLGSSQSFGLFVPAEQTVSALLEKELAAAGHPGVTVGNCGVVGHHFLATLRTAERLREVKRPELVVVLVRPWHLKTQVDYTRTLQPRNPWVRWGVERSSLLRLIWYLSNRERDQMDKPSFSDADLAARLRVYAERTRPAGVQTLFLFLDDGRGDDAYRRLEAVLAQTGFPSQRIATPNGQQREYFVDRDEHFSLAGATLTAKEMVAPVLRELEPARLGTTLTP